MSRFILTAVALLGLGAGPGAKPTAGPKPAATCTTVSKRDIGGLPLSVTVGSVKVDFVEWKTRDVNEPDSVVGFSIAANGPLIWVAQLGDERGFTGADTEFLDELALVKVTAPTLSRITFCDAR